MSVSLNWQWIVLALVGLVVLIVAVLWLYRRIRHPERGCGCGCCGTAGRQVPPTEARRGQTQLDLVAPAIHCEGCASTIVDALSKMEGVASVQVDVATHTIHLEMAEQSELKEKIIRRLTKLGFPPQA